ncbi:FAD binding domain-containing protein [Seiridium cupressi]
MLESANGKRQLVWTMSSEPDRQLASDILEIWRQEVAPMVNFTGILPAIQFQPATPNVFRAMKRNGGNALGLEDRNKTLMVMNWSVGWVDPADDEAVYAAYARITRRVTELEQSRGLYHPFKYANYAHPSQDPVSSYGYENKKKVVEISRKYDPTGLFQRNPGQFKLNGQAQ